MRLIPLPVILNSNHSGTSCANPCLIQSYHSTFLSLLHIVTSRMSSMKSKVFDMFHTSLSVSSGILAALLIIHISILARVECTFSSCSTSNYLKNYTVSLSLCRILFAQMTTTCPMMKHYGPFLSDTDNLRNLFS